VRLGLIWLLTVQLHLDIHQQDEPPLPAAAAKILTLNSLPTTPKTPAAGFRLFLIVCDIHVDSPRSCVSVCLCRWRVFGWV
jgi:hypothetical protein